MGKSDEDWETEEEVTGDEDSKMEAHDANAASISVQNPSSADQGGVVPEFDDLVKAVAEVKAANPDFGQKRILAAIKSAHPQWSVSEKRLQKAIAELPPVAAGGYRASSAPSAAAQQAVDPVALDDAGRIAGSGDAFNYGFGTLHGAVDLSDPAELERMVRDCRAAFRNKSYWLAADAAPRFSLEWLARAVFEYHTARLGPGDYDPARTGAEWWVHFRGPAAADGEAIGFHWDRDEYYADAAKQNVHPQIATVTYLSDHGAPTMILEQVPIAPGRTATPRTAYLSHPRLGKHASFDGRLLHGVPPELMVPQARKAGYTRITFLVNIWVNHRLLNTEPWPDSDASLISPSPFRTDFGGPGRVHAPTTVRTTPASKVRGFSFGGNGEEHELWVPVCPAPDPFNDAVTIDYGPRSQAKVIRPAARAGGSKRKGKR